MLKSLQRIENCVHNAFEKVKYEHGIDADIVTFIHREDNNVLRLMLRHGGCTYCATV